jgi:hypothetical protein
MRGPPGRACSVWGAFHFCFSATALRPASAT